MVRGTKCLIDPVKQDIHLSPSGIFKSLFNMIINQLEIEFLNSKYGLLKYKKENSDWAISSSLSASAKGI